MHNCEQGSDEWLNLRKGVATASNFSEIITSTGKETTSRSSSDPSRLEKYALELATNTLLSKVEDGYKNANMQRGNDLEPFARQAYQEETFALVKECGFITTDCGRFGYSPDGLVGDDGLIEIKCPLAKTHFGYILDDKCPNDYYAQVQGGLFITGRKWLDFVSYHPDFKQPLFVKRVERDEEFIAKLEVLLEKVDSLKRGFLTKWESK